MIELVDLTDWKKMREIKLELHREYGINISRDGREFRNAVQKWNELWANGEVPYCITHSNQKGYKRTTDYNEAEIAVNDYNSRMRNLSKQAKNIKRGFEVKNNKKFNFNKGEIV